MCFAVIVFTYYKLIFDQINQRVESIANVKLNQVNNKLIRRLIHRLRERQLIKLIDEHNKAAIEIYKINLILRRSGALILILLSLSKIVVLYLIITTDDVLVKVYVWNLLIFLIFIGLGMSYSFSNQIRSAHKSYNSIH